MPTEEKKPRKKRYVSKEEREKRSKKMKAYWAKKKKAEVVANVESREAMYRIRYEPRPHQYRITKAIDAGKRFIAVHFGIRSGKTYAGANEILRWMYDPDKEHRNHLAWIIAPIYDLAKVAQRLCEKMAGPLIMNYRRADKTYIMRPRSPGEPPWTVEVKTADNPDRLRGAEPDVIWWDEPAQCDDGTFEILIGRVSTTRGLILMTGTPTGLTHWYYDKIVKRALADEPGFAHVAGKTSDNPDLTDEDLALLREAYTDEFAAQELDGDFINLSGLIYKDFLYDKHTFDLSQMLDSGKLDTAEWICGIDWGYNDPFAFLWIARVGDRYYVVDEYYRSGEIPSTHLAAVQAVPFTGRLQKLYADISRPESAEEFERGLEMPIDPGRTEREDRIPGIEYISSLFKRGELHVARHCRRLITELGKYSWKKRKDLNSKDEPIDSYNHALDALRYALYSHRGDKPVRSVRRTGPEQIQISQPGQEDVSAVLKRIRARRGEEQRASGRAGWMGRRGV